MKFLTTNFLKCSVKGCDTSNDNFPLSYGGCQLVQDSSIDFNPEFLINVLDRVDWPAVVRVARELGNDQLPEQKPAFEVGEEGVFSEDQLAVLTDLHTLLMQTSIVEGEMKCRNCGHTYYIKNSIPNLLLPPHLA
ncbi:Multifunctional methyltransferase subunit TRM112 [Nakaseomyces bracarensis]|uniref:Multifunctional methyltransferase subunit TRM112 n=1 Tax=Nakaseomyces bracarensis TaxID=273131 RepID=A0ABR4NSF8_9SACH